MFCMPSAGATLWNIDKSLTVQPKLRQPPCDSAGIVLSNNNKMETVILLRMHVFIMFHLFHFIRMHVVII